MATTQAGGLMTALLMQLILVSLPLAFSNSMKVACQPPGPLDLSASPRLLGWERTGFERSFLVTLPPCVSEAPSLNFSNLEVDPTRE